MLMQEKITWEDWITRCLTFSSLGPVSLCGFTIPFDYMTVSLLVVRIASDMWSFMPARLPLGDLGAPGSGEPWFPLELCCFFHMSLCMPQVLLFSVSCFVLSRHTMIPPWCTRYLFSTELALFTMPILRFGCFCLFCFWFLSCVACVLLLFGCWLVLLFWCFIMALWLPYRTV